jgi:hypothetical protein
MKIEAAQEERNGKRKTQPQSGLTETSHQVEAGAAARGTKRRSGDNRVKRYRAVAAGSPV